MNPKLPSIQEEIGQARPFASRRQEALISLMRTADDLRRFVGQSVAPAGVTLQQYNVLRILKGARGEELPTLEIADRMVERTPGVTRLLDQLEKRGLVDRRRCTNDRRRVLCRITLAGSAVLEELAPGVGKADEDAVGSLTEAELDELLVLLARIRQGLADG